MKMISTTRRQNSLSLSGGHIISDSLNLPSYSPNAVSTVAQPFPWGDEIDDINTPDIDPSFFDNGPFHKFGTQKSQLDQMDEIASYTTEEALFLAAADQTSFTTADDTNQQSIHHSLEDNFDLSSLINQTTVDSMVSPNDVLENQYIPSTTAPVLHYLEARPVESIASTVSLDFINPSIIDSLNSQSLVESYPQISSPTYSIQSYPSALPSLSQTYASPTPSPALSYTSTKSQSTLVSAMDGITSDTNTIDSLIETKPDPEFLQPTVINDHVYSLSQSSSRKRKSTDKASPRLKNNVASKKSRVTKRDKQKDLEERERFLIEDNAKCRKSIEEMEKQIQYCKDYLFKKVVGSHAPQRT